MRSLNRLYTLVCALVIGIAGAASAADLQEKIAEIAKSARGNVGVEVSLIETGETVSLHAEGHYPMQSVYKLPIAMATLHEVEQGRLKLDTPIRLTPSDYVRKGQASPLRDSYPRGVTVSVTELLQYMMTVSDGSACDALLKAAGGPSAVMRYLKSLDITTIMVATTEKEMGKSISVQYRNWASPAGMMILLRRLNSGAALSEPDRALLLKMMRDSQTGVNRIRGLLQSGTVVADKTGTSGTHHGITAATNDVGLVTLPGGKHLAIAVFVSDAKADDTVREGVIARISRAAWDHWHDK